MAGENLLALASNCVANEDLRTSLNARTGCMLFEPPDLRACLRVLPDSIQVVVSATPCIHYASMQSFRLKERRSAFGRRPEAAPEGGRLRASNSFLASSL